ncbi:rod shape-determining protein MreC [Aureitalea marina]|uniref:Cell shape-determining protein MreC n=1 Tax=Aureitalea marina TaxID=930804 RepID=A0A2S7KLR5_9FLAO|nr:rod shape-determining protein MreC [Aureitalea marina]PQB03576.1 rod shape-determining protein MreC [Aureitalea marina]
MQRIIFFLIRNKNFLLFLLLFGLSLLLTANSRSYQGNRIGSSANAFSGGLFSISSTVRSYFQLSKENQALQEENTRLRLMLNQEEDLDSLPVAVGLDTTYSYIPARVINNHYNRSRNYVTLNVGDRDSVKIDMGVISPKGVVGIISATSNGYSSVQSVLNISSQINAKLQKSGHFGTLVWDTRDPNLVQLIEIPRLAPVSVGDTIVTGGRSTIFPEGIMIGVVEGLQREEREDFYDLQVRLFSDMTSLSVAYVIQNRDAEEIENLEESVDNEE